MNNSYSLNKPLDNDDDLHTCSYRIMCWKARKVSPIPELCPMELLGHAVAYIGTTHREKSLVWDIGKCADWLQGSSLTKRTA